ncbi:MAG: DUF4190 domain-containing protein [Phycisphaerales bacterium]|nr:DUF4190 domain-containing protein [Planctomycetota bacterium]MCH8509296.1 DUF4190 domain-containing protein [Phycisphaerales bacterium]
MTQHTTHPTPMHPPPPPPPGGPHGPGGGGHDQSRPLSQLALWSMIVGILSLCIGPIGVAAVVMGIIAITRTSKPDGPSGLGFAIAGTTLGAIGIMSTCLQIGILLPAIGKARMTAAELNAQTKLREIGVGLQQYAARNDDQFPPEADWQQLLLNEAFVQYGGFDPARHGSTFVYIGAGPADGDPNRIIVYEDAPQAPGNRSVLYADGHVERLEPEELRRRLEAQAAGSP